MLPINEEGPPMASATPSIMCQASGNDDLQISLSIVSDQVPTIPILRDYQQALTQSVKAAFLHGVSAVCLQLPTGGGKTVVFCSIVADHVAAGDRVLILAHRVEILDQICAALRRFGIVHGVIAPDRPETADCVQVASIATIARRLDKWRDQFDLVIADECHHAVAASWLRVIKAMPRAKILGVTATPERLDGRGLRDVFDLLIVGPSVAALIDLGYLAPAAVFAPAKSPDLDGVGIRAGDFKLEDLRPRMGGFVIQSSIDEYIRLCRRHRAIFFCVDRKHSKDVVAALRRAGIAAIHIDAETSPEARKAALAAFAAGEIEVICNVALFGEGLDLPSVESVVILRPTRSVALHLQMIGRALRPASGKDRAIVLDFAGNTTRLGLPDAPREWSLDAKPRRERAKGDNAAKRCHHCGALNPAPARECAECGESFTPKRNAAEIKMQLVEARAAQETARIAAMNYAARLRWAGADRERLQAVARACGYKSGWVWHQLREQGAAHG